MNERAMENPVARKSRKRRVNEEAYSTCSSAFHKLKRVQLAGMRMVEEKEKARKKLRSRADCVNRDI